MLEYKVEGGIGLPSVNTEKTERAQLKEKEKENLFLYVKSTLFALIWVSGSHLLVSCVKPVRKSCITYTEFAH